MTLVFYNSLNGIIDSTMPVNSDEKQCLEIFAIFLTTFQTNDCYFRHFASFTKSNEVKFLLQYNFLVMKLNEVGRFVTFMNCTKCALQLKFMEKSMFELASEKCFEIK